MIPGVEAQRERREKLVLFVALSLLAHLLVMLVFYRTDFAGPVKVPDNTIFVDLDRLPPPLASMQEKQPRQVVESERAEQSEPKEARYLGERDQSVAQETKAARVESFRKGGAAGQAGRGGKPSLALKDLAPPSSKPVTPPTSAEIDGFRQRRMARSEHNNGGPAGDGSVGSATSDYLKDVKDGDRTLLNTKEFVYMGYYRRIREKLEVAWNSRLRAAMGPYGGRRLANDKSYITGLIVVLDKFGTIKAVKVLQRSGARDLDEAAVGAFNEAGPFPDPPSGLIDKNGQIEVRWDFILQS